MQYQTKYLHFNNLHKKSSFFESSFLHHHFLTSSFDPTWADKSPNGDVLTCSGTNHPALFTNNFTLMDLSLPVEGLLKITEDDVLSVFVRLYHRSPVIPGIVMAK